MKIDIYNYLGSKRKSTQLDVVGSEFFLNINMNKIKKNYRISVDSEGNLILALINGHDAKIISERNYPAIKLIGR